MFLSITAKQTEGFADARDLGFILHKHPDRCAQFPQSNGVAHVFCPAASEREATAALLLEVDPIGLGHYVTDRPYAASSMLAVALGKVFSTALAGVCRSRPELVELVLPLDIEVPALPCSGGETLARKVFEPLGWTVRTSVVPLDLPGGGDSRYVNLRLSCQARVCDALSQLYVLLPVLDGSKHYWVTSDEIDKLVRRGGSWLARHPERDLITRRYLAHRRSFINDAFARLAELEDIPTTPDVEFVPLVQHRKTAVLSALGDVGASRVVDIGCGSGSLLVELLADQRFSFVLGTDVSASELTRAARRLHLDRMPERQRARVELLQSSVTYRDDRLMGFDAAVLMEVIEHLDPERLPALERNVFGAAHPGAVIVTTPNADYNVRYPGLGPGESRHPDHRFEWTRAEFASWATAIASQYGYSMELRAAGEKDPEVGPPTQLALFRALEVVSRG